MKHYDYSQWKLYEEDLLDSQLKREMEEHLLVCNSCMEIFLSTVDEDVIDIEFSYDFMDKIMNEIDIVDRDKKVLSINKNKNNIQKDFILYYIAVASVAVFLTANGFFGSIMDSNINSKVRYKKPDEIVRDVDQVSNEIVNRTSIFINNFNRERND